MGNTTTSQASYTNSPFQQAQAQTARTLAKPQRNTTTEDDFPELKTPGPAPPSNYVPEYLYVKPPPKAVLGDPNKHLELDWIATKTGKYKHYDIVTPKADHMLVETLPVRPGKDPN